MSYQTIALITAIVLPFWNLPLIYRIIKRRSSEDISTYWAVGVWACLLLMAPSAFFSQDKVWRVYSIINFISFSGVFIAVLIFRVRAFKQKLGVQDAEGS